MAENRHPSPDRSGAAARGADVQPAAPVSTSNGLQPADSASPQGERTDSEPERKAAEQDSEQDTLIRQRLESREADSTPAVGGAAAKRGASPAPAQRPSSCDGEEKRDQSKEEPPLDIEEQEGQWRRFAACP